MNEVLILIDQTLLDTLWAQAHPPVTRPPASVPPAAQPLAYAGVRGGAARSDWLTVEDGGTTYEALNMVGPQVDQFIADNSADIFAVYGWTQGNGLDNDGTKVGDYRTDPQGVLDLMPDNYGGTATFTNPNWRHAFAGQPERIFAGDFKTEDFNGDFL